jgi:hypothetical protein
MRIALQDNGLGVVAPTAPPQAVFQLALGASSGRQYEPECGRTARAAATRSRQATPLFSPSSGQRRLSRHQFAAAHRNALPVP